jgi:hypothetical protein
VLFRSEDYVHHLSRLADAYAAEPELAGWVHAERALHLTWRLGKTELARGALERALRLAPGSKPVRRAYMQLLAGSNDVDRAYTFNPLPAEGGLDWVEAVPR